MKVKALKKLLEKCPDNFEVQCCDDEAISGAMSTDSAWIDKESKAFIISHEFYDPK